MKLKGIGFGIADRITAFLDSQQAPVQSDTPKKMVIRKELLQIPGLGVKKTQELIDAGCKSLKDLHSRKFLPMLSRKQQVYFKYMDHLNQPITRAEAEAVAQFMRDNLRSAHEVILAGDYRRGLKSFPQLKIVLLHPNHVNVPIPAPPNSPNPPRPPRLLSRSPAVRQRYLSVANKLPNPLHGDAVPNLQNRGLICETMKVGDRTWDGIIRIPELVESARKETASWGDRHERIMAIAQMKGAFRQMSIVLTPQKSRAATMLAMTGDPEFVKYMRYKALSLELYLDEFGLWRWHSRSSDVDPPSAEKTDQNMDGYWELVQVSTEEDIFSVLGMEYVPPARRTFGFLKVNTKRP
ncbi:hypothetical protein M378DRAFT_159259 [Amanita muscaria Koide BX008]|uniref:DNA polymerase n=1 Tax=Amanita muscaria (strain Koide BX008) TaxID=946122 RepID=A0A0C2XF34_AMAMK|nr:hypothetical protein M378DRAFT_159259 [Amanita muscaria Koide BX008]